MREEPTISGLRRLFRLPTSQARVAREVDDELRFHLDSRVADLVARGMARDDAERIAAQEYGDLAASRAELVVLGRRRRRRTWLVDCGWSVVADVRYAFRQMARAPLFSAVIVLVLAVGIGANSAVFTIVRAFTTRAAPGIPSPEQFVRVVPLRESAGPHSRGVPSGEPNLLSYEAFHGIQRRTDVFVEAAAWRLHQHVAIDAGERSTSASVLAVTSGYFPDLHVSMARGIAFGSPADSDTDRSAVAVVSHRLAQRSYGSDSDAIGRTVKVSGVPLTIVGVAQPPFNGVDYTAFGDRVDVWVPMALQATIFSAEDAMRAALTKQWKTVDRSYAMFVRLHRGVDGPHAVAVASAILGADYLAHPQCCIQGQTLSASFAPLSALGAGVAMRDLQGNFLVLGGVGLLILLISCANVSSLLLARAVVRRQEIAVRLSLGADRGRVVRQLLTESTLLATLAAGLGIVATFAIAAVVGARSGVPVDLTPDGVTISLSVAVAMATGVLFGIVPALHASRASVSDALKDRVAGIDWGGTRWHGALTVAQIALGAAFVCATGALFGAAIGAHRVSFGLRGTDHLLTAELEFGDNWGPQEARIRRLKERISALPGVSAASATPTFPLLGGLNPEGGAFELVTTTDGGVVEAANQGEQAIQPWDVMADPEFFAAAGLPILRGRALAATDIGPDFVEAEPGKYRKVRSGTPYVVVVSEDYARRMWPGADPIGKVVNLPAEPTSTVVGVVPAVHMTFDTAHATPAIYRSRDQVGSESRTVYLLVRTLGQPEALAASLQRAITEVDPTIGVENVRPFDASRDDAVAAVLDTAGGAGILSIVALILASVGAFAVVTFRVTQRTREIGIRIALGAQAREIAGLFIMAEMKHTLSGLVAGLCLAVLIVPRVASLVGGSGFVNYTFGAAFLLIVPVVIGVATWVPARRATRVDPAIVLRSE